MRMLFFSHAPIPPAALIAPICAACIALLPPDAATAMSDRIERIVDGDTVVLNEVGKARLIGIDAPETVSLAQRQGAPSQCYGPEASARTRMLLPLGTSVRVEFDTEPTDKFGRSLVYLYLRDDDETFVNGELVRDGFARAKAYKPNVRYKAELERLQAEAKAAGSGLWGQCEAAKSNAGRGFDSRADAAASSKSDKELRPARTPAELRQREAALASSELTNPGDTKNCADFGTYDEAKAWFDTYYPKFGDVAKLDGNGDGVPCESLLKRAKATATS